MEQFVIDQIKYGAKYIPLNIAKYPFIKKSTKETRDLRSKEFICGVCHPSSDYKQIREANIGWVRFDIPFPFNKEGEIQQSYLNFKLAAKEYQKNGIKVMSVTPYPRDYFDFGVDPRTEEGKEKVREIARFFISDLQGVVSGIQVTNEMGIPHFTLPFENMDEAASFIGIQLEEMYPNRNNILLGYNSAGPQADLHIKLKSYYKFCDYIGIDIYIGCMMVGGFMWMFDALLDYLYALTGKPIIIQEFGYIGGGKPMSKHEKQKLLREHGVKSEAEAKANIEEFVASLSDYMQAHVKNVCQNDPSRYYNLIFKSDYRDHFYKQIPKYVKIPGYNHTPVGQAKFYNDIFERLYNKQFVVGAFIYSYHDAHACHVCGQEDCPTETKWGLTDRQGNPKPSYYAVKKIFGRIKWYSNTEKNK